MATLSSNTAIGFPYRKEMDISSLLSGLQDQLYGSKNSGDVAAVANAMSSGAVAQPALGTANVTDLFGLSPEHIKTIADTRSAIQYQDILTKLGALKFSKELSNTEAKTQLANELISGEQKGRLSKELADIHGRWSLAAAGAGAGSPAQQEMIRIMNLKSSPDPYVRASVSPAQEAFFGTFVGKLKSTDANQILMNASLYDSDPKKFDYLRGMKELAPLASAVLQREISGDTSTDSRITELGGQRFVYEPDGLYSIKDSKKGKKVFEVSPKGKVFPLGTKFDENGDPIR